MGEKLVHFYQQNIPNTSQTTFKKQNEINFNVYKTPQQLNIRSEIYQYFSLESINITFIFCDEDSIS